MFFLRSELISFPGSLIYITCTYIPAASESPEYLNHLFALQSNKPYNRYNLVILGDFNIPEPSWSTDEKTNVFLPLHDFSETLLTIFVSS